MSDNTYLLGLCLGAAWGVAAGVLVIGPWLRDERERRRRDLRAAVAEALEADRRMAAMMARRPPTPSPTEG